MNIEVTLSHAHLKAEQVSAEHVTAIIQGFFQQPILIEATPIKQAVETQTNTPKQLSKINATRTLHTPIGDIVAQKQWETGIKVREDGTKHYQAYYWCECGDKGKRYIAPTDTTLCCRACEQALVVEPATLTKENGLPERDTFGNFFIARELV